MDRIERSKSERSSRLLFYSAIVVLHDVIDLFSLPDFNRRSQFLVVGRDGSGVSTALIYVDFHWSTVVRNGFTQKP